MPYIRPEQRDLLTAVTEGQLNYQITRLCIKFLGTNPGYESYNAVIGVLECAKMEFYRRAVVPFEKKKCKQNGDCY